MKQLLSIPVFYQWFQQLGGFFGARIKGIAEFVLLRPSMRVLDIGCGPGYIVQYLPKSVTYIGFDIDASYIKFAESKFGSRGQFYCKYFNKEDASKLASVDVVMMNGVLHHISDEELKTTLENVYTVLKPGGMLFTLDGCYVLGQSRFRRWMLDNDRGKYVRDLEGYRKLLEREFSSVEFSIRDNYSWVPYTFAIGRAVK
jgi:cyclopropane fatty-acyl-phospholipid synthase-like methyltransferase